MEQEDNTRKVVVKKLIQNQTHADRDALKADLKQNQAYNPFSEKSKNMIHSMWNVEYFEMCKISPNFQSLYCLTYCTKGKDRLHKKAGGTNEKIHPRTGWIWCFQPPQAHGGDQLTSGGTDRTGMNSDFF